MSCDQLALALYASSCEFYTQERFRDSQPCRAMSKVERTGGYAHLGAQLLNEYTGLNLSHISSNPGFCSETQRCMQDRICGQKKVQKKTIREELKTTFVIHAYLHKSTFSGLRVGVCLCVRVHLPGIFHMLSTICNPMKAGHNSG